MSATRVPGFTRHLGPLCSSRNHRSVASGPAAVGTTGTRALLGASAGAGPTRARALPGPLRAPEPPEGGGGGASRELRMPGLPPGLLDGGRARRRVSSASFGFFLRRASVRWQNNERSELEAEFRDIPGSSPRENPRSSSRVLLHRAGAGRIWGPSCVLLISSCVFFPAT